MATDKPAALNPTGKPVPGDELDDEGKQIAGSSRQTAVGVPLDDPDAEAERQEALKSASETVPGGAYKVNGEWVDANGDPLKSKVREQAEANAKAKAQAQARTQAEAEAAAKAKPKE